ncbi:hypothetical protein OZ410_06055 [Robiginitalea sp. M366]|uniref:hypothetical protein n=1 Tax=Robiginitalea aestuariiviva TaxID=3036903 RepID=UPI00240D6574|nr:hypothetical protein [Robiginitalea aestuariiviva]MDG1571871.1 hypothetical protein [Robiginitalea aestuariiviva]
MIRILKYTEYVYLAIALISLFEISRFWDTNRDRAFLFIFFAAVSLGMFFFRRNYRRRFEKHKDSNKS